MLTVEVHGLSKRFRLDREPYQSLKERVIHFGNTRHEDFWALRDIDFEVPEGTTLGLLGHNGSGKSTLLKCIAGILRPTTGEITTRGRVAALLELGAGFQPELTGRENIFLNGLILGMSRKDLARRFDEIVDFAEIEQFIDTQVRFYSSGMYVRLGFAIAVNVDPDILLVDEVLAVGDEAFQRKCLERVERFQQEGRTIVVVSHSPELVKRVCQLAAVLHHGEQVAFGDPGESVQVFREHLRVTPAKARPGEPPPLDDRIRFTGVTFQHPGGAAREVVEPGDPLEIHVRFDVDAPVEDPVFTLMIHDSEGRSIHAVSTAKEGLRAGRLSKVGELVFAFKSIPLVDGDYAVTLCATSSDGQFIYDWQEQRYHFKVRDAQRTFNTDDFPVTVTLNGQAARSRAVS